MKIIAFHCRSVAGFGGHKQLLRGIRQSSKLSESASCSSHARMSAGWQLLQVWLKGPQMLYCSLALHVVRLLHDSFSYMLYWSLLSCELSLLFLLLFTHALLGKSTQGLCTASYPQSHLASG
jgi:hypothetical protein